MKKSNVFQNVHEKLVYSFQSRKRFMSNLYLAVEKVTGSLVGNSNVERSLGLAANDKRIEGVAFTQDLFLHTLLCPTGTQTYPVCPRQGSFFEHYVSFVRVMHSILDLALRKSQYDTVQCRNMRRSDGEEADVPNPCQASSYFPCRDWPLQLPLRQGSFISA